MNQIPFNGADVTDTELSGSSSPVMINNRYNIVKHLGAGGMGEVYLVEDILFESTVMALKQIHESRVNPRNLRAFHNEFRAMTRLKHPNLVQVFDFGFDGSANSYYLTLEYVDGYPLRELRNKVSRVSSEQVIFLFVDLCRALAFMHSRNIVHRDINPGNIMCSYAGQVKLMDFGLVDIGMEVQQSKGTIAYMAPEVINGSPDHRTDIFSLGLTFYEALTATPFYDQSNAQHIINLLRDKDAFSQHRSRCISAYPAAESLRPLFERMLAFESEERFQNCTEIIAAVNTLRGTEFSFETEKTKEAYVRGAEFVGREKELNQLKEQFTAAHTTAVWVQGEAGIGKSRLFYEFKNWCQLNTITFLEGTCYENINRQFGPFLPVVSELLLHASEELVSEHGPKLKKILPTHSRFTNVSAVEIRDPKTEHIIIVKALAQCIVDCIITYPHTCALYLNDMQWSDESSIEVIDALLTYASLVNKSQHHLHLYLSSRTESIESLEEIISKHAIDTIQLSTLSTDCIERYIAAIFGKSSIGFTFLQSVDQIHAKVGGNPLFLQELIKSLVDTGTLVHTEKFWELVKPFDHAVIPKSLEELIITRVNKLSLHTEELFIVQVIALLNRSISLHELHGIGTTSSDFLWRLADEEILKIKQKGSVILYEIAHDLIQSAIITTIPNPESIHRHIAFCLEEMHKEELQSYYEELAHHYYRAKQHDKAIVYLNYSLNKAVNNFENKKALIYYDMISELLCDDQVEERIKLLEGKSNILCLVFGKYHEALSATGEMAELADKGGFTKELAFAYQQMGYIANLIDDTAERSIQFMKKALRTYEAINHKEGIATTYMLLLYIYYDVEKNYDKALECFKKGISAAAESEKKAVTAKLLGNASQVYEALGNFQEAIDCVTQALQIFKDEDKKNSDYLAKRNYMLCIGHQGAYYANMGKYVHALECFDQRIALADNYGIIVEKVFGLIKKADTLFALKKFQKAKACIDTAQIYYNEINDSKAIFMGTVVGARIEYACGNKKKAIGILTDLLKTITTRHKVAKIYYELWRMSSNETFRDHALKSYREITVSTKNWLYLKRLQELEMNIPSEHVFTSKTGKKSTLYRNLRPGGYGYR